MSKRKSKRGGRLMSASAAPSMANGALEAARFDDSWPYMPWPLLPNFDIDGWDQRMIWQRGRALYHNSSQIRKAVKSMIHFTGVLQPLPMTADAEWNRLAREAFLARTKNPFTFDLAGRTNYKQALRFIERCAIVDGDVAIVPTYAADGGALFAFYKAPQISGGGVQGVEVNAQGRATGYYIMNAEGKAVKLDAHRVILYQHDVDPSRYRGVSELVASLKHANDVHNIVGYAKNGQMISNSMGLVSTMQPGAKKSDVGRFVGGGNAKVNAASAGPDKPRTLAGTGLQITHLPEGCDLRAINDGRPSGNLQEFFKFLVRCIAQGVGLDPEVLFYSNEMGSAATRFSLEKVRKWQEERLDDLEIVCNRIWRHVIACEVKMGRLRPCNDTAWTNVHWVPSTDMTIDTPRVAKAQIDLTREGLASSRDFTLRTTGRTPEDLAEERAAELAARKVIAEKYGLTVQELYPGSVGSIPTVSEAVPADELPAPHDEDPEEVD